MKKLEKICGISGTSPGLAYRPYPAEADSPRAIDEYKWKFLQDNVTAHADFQRRLENFLERKYMYLLTGRPDLWTVLSKLSCLKCEWRLAVARTYGYCNKYFPTRKYDK